MVQSRTVACALASLVAPPTINAFTPSHKHIPNNPLSFLTKGLPPNPLLPKAQSTFTKPVLPSPFTSPTTAAAASTSTTTSNNRTSMSFGSSGEKPRRYPTYGGDYAGHVASFSATDGKLIPVPEYYLPDSLIEWGQIPSSFEVLTSEDLVLETVNAKEKEKEKADHDGTEKWKLNRVGVRVVPEVGCGIDNLDTLVKEDSLPLSSFLFFQDDESAQQTDVPSPTKEVPLCSSSLYYPNTGSSSKEETILETVFLLPPTYSNNNNNDDDDDDDETDLLSSYHGRIRIRLASHPESTRLSTKTPLEITVERKTSSVGTGGSVAEGGGLTGSTVFRLIGKDYMSKPFSDGTGVSLDRLVGRWKKRTVMTTTMMTQDGDQEIDGSIVAENVWEDSYWKNDDSVRTLSLPGNVVVRYEDRPEGRVVFPWSVEVSHIITNGEEDGEDCVWKRRVVKRTFEEDGTSVVQCWDEIKETDVSKT